MARFGLKKQGRLWGFFHGSELVSEATGVVGGNALRDPAPPEQQPAYDNDAEYGNVKTAWKEAKHHPPLEAPEKQRERQRLEEEIEALATALESKHRRGKAIVWDAEAEEELHALMQTLAGLLKLVGLSVHQG